LGWLYARLDENDKAVDACNNALKLDPDSAWVHYGLGRIYVILGKLEKAIESYKQAIQLQSDFVEAYLFLGLTYAELGDQKKAIDSYSEAILLDRHYPEPHFFLGVAYDESGQYKKAIESFEQAITWYNSKETKIRINSLGIKPDLATLNCIIGVCHLRLGQEFKASLAFKDSIDIDDSHAGAHYGLALAYFLLGQKDAAVEEYEAVKALKGEEMAKPLFEIIYKDGSLERQ
jgi:tetratricopeptide (TPR) repeat protein